MNKAGIILVFIGGTLVGSSITWRLLEKKYAKLAQEEIDSVKERFSVPKNPTEDSAGGTRSKVEQAREKPDLLHYKSSIDNMGYTNYGEYSTPLEESPSEDDDFPYVISPDDFGELEDYETISLTYYADKVLTDDMDDIIIDVDSVVGPEALTSFGAYEDDAVFVRNDSLHCDYEILLDTRAYADTHPDH